jgi:hypothetical protein
MVLWCAYLMAYYAHGQDNVINPSGEKGRKGSVYITWGYNRAYYGKSDVHLKGEHYDFVIHDARAEDMPEKFDPSVYFNFNQLTVPQFNFRVGYYFNENTAFSLGWDHMKYRLITTQLVRISGEIDPEYYNLSGFTGIFDHTPVIYQPKFMDYHHSDGFNYIRAGIERRLPLTSLWNGKLELVMVGGVSAGVMLPWTDFTFFGVHHRNKLHLAGYAGSVNAGFRAEFLKWFFIQVNAQAGWANMPDIVLEDHLPSRASQQISFFERSWALGGYIPVRGLFKKK